MEVWAIWSSWRCPCSLQEAWARWHLKFPSNPKHSMYLCVYDSVILWYSPDFSLLWKLCFSFLFGFVYLYSPASETYLSHLEIHDSKEQRVSVSKVVWPRDVMLTPILTFASLHLLKRKTGTLTAILNRILSMVFIRMVAFCFLNFQASLTLTSGKKNHFSIFLKQTVCSLLLNVIYTLLHKILQLSSLLCFY